MDVQGHVLLKDPKTKNTYTGLLWSELLTRAPAHISVLFDKQRGRRELGHVVHNHFVKMTNNRMASQTQFNVLQLLIFTCMLPTVMSQCIFPVCPFARNS